jgi:hypothetical protein
LIWLSRFFPAIPRVRLGLEEKCRQIFVGVRHSHCYIVIFTEIYRHNNTIAILILDSKLIRKRNQQNAITFAGQFATWLLHSFYILVTAIFINISKTGYSREVIAVLKTSEFLLVPLIHIYTSPPLKNFVFSSKTE